MWVSMEVRKRRRTRSDFCTASARLRRVVCRSALFFEHNQYTFEGGLERQQAFLDGLRPLPKGGKRVVGMTVVGIPAHVGRSGPSSFFLGQPWLAERRPEDDRVATCTGVPCFVGAEWKLFAKPFKRGGVFG